MRFRFIKDELALSMGLGKVWVEASPLWLFQLYVINEIDMVEIAVPCISITFYKYL